MSKKLFVIASLMAAILVGCDKTPEEKAAEAAEAAYAENERLNALEEAAYQAKLDALPEINAENCYNVNELVDRGFHLVFKNKCRRAGHSLHPAGKGWNSKGVIE